MARKVGLPAMIVTSLKGGYEGYKALVQLASLTRGQREALLDGWPPLREWGKGDNPGAVDRARFIRDGVLPLDTLPAHLRAWQTGGAAEAMEANDLRRLLEESGLGDE